jgi:glycosyltransferase involved in cell wall biosynthesis
MMLILHLTASRFVGGPEYQMLGLSRELGGDYRSAFVSFAEGGLCQSFLDRAREEGFEASKLKNDTPFLMATTQELGRLMADLSAKIVCSHGYKSDLIGLTAARRMGIPIVAVSHGWTCENFRVRLYEAVDRLALRRMDRVVCVSEAQAAKVRVAGVSRERIVVIRDAIRGERFEATRAEYLGLMQRFFSAPGTQVVGAAGRLSPEKGFADLIAAARAVAQTNPSIRFVLFGDGRLRQDLQRRVEAAGLQGTFVLAGFRSDIDRFLPHLDLLVLPSYTEGLPNVILEAFAAGVPVVATAVGGTPEIVEDGVNGRLVAPGNPGLLAQTLIEVLGDDSKRRAMGQEGRRRVLCEFTFAGQGQAYRRVFEDLIAQSQVEFVTRIHRG